jgi:hypothetical protein
LVRLRADGCVLCMRGSRGVVVGGVVGKIHQPVNYIKEAWVRDCREHRCGRCVLCMRGSRIQQRGSYTKEVWVQRCGRCGRVQQTLRNSTKGSVRYCSSKRSSTGVQRVQSSCSAFPRPITAPGAVGAPRLDAVFRALDIAADVLVQVDGFVVRLGQPANSAILFLALGTRQYVASLIAGERRRVIAWVPHNALGAIDESRVVRTLLCQFLGQECQFELLCFDQAVSLASGRIFTHKSRVIRCPTRPAKCLHACRTWMGSGG